MHVNPDFYAAVVPGLDDAECSTVDLGATCNYVKAMVMTSNVWASV